MSEQNRTTWREFVEWLRRKRSDKDGELKRVAPEVQTRGEAALVCRFVLGLGRTSTGHCVDEWFAFLRSQGISPPADPPNMAEVLEKIAEDCDGRAKRCISVAESGRLSDESSPRLCAMSKVFSEMAAVVRAKAKEFA